MSVSLSADPAVAGGNHLPQVHDAQSARAPAGRRLHGRARGPGRAQRGKAGARGRLRRGLSQHHARPERPCGARQRHQRGRGRDRPATRRRAGAARDVPRRRSPRPESRGRRRRAGGVLRGAGAPRRPGARARAAGPPGAAAPDRQRAARAALARAEPGPRSLLARPRQHARPSPALVGARLSRPARGPRRGASRCAPPCPGPWRSAAVGEAGRGIAIGPCSRPLAGWLVLALALGFLGHSSLAECALDARGGARRRACARDRRGHARLRSRGLPARRGLAPAPGAWRPRRRGVGTTTPCTAAPRSRNTCRATAFTSSAGSSSGAGSAMGTARSLSPRSPRRRSCSRSRALLSLPLLGPELAHALGRLPVWPVGGHGRRRRRADPRRSCAHAAHGTLEPCCARSPRSGRGRRAWPRPDCCTWRSSPSAA